MAEITLKQRIVVNVSGKDVDGAPASLEGGTITYGVTNDQVGRISDENGPTAKLNAVAAGEVAVVVNFTKGELVLTATSETVTVKANEVASIEVTFGEVEAQ